MRRHLRLPSGLALLACVAASPAGTQPAPAQPAPTRDVSVRVSLGVGAVYLHQPAFTYTRGTANPRPFNEQATDAGAVAIGGGLEVLGTRWWSGVGAQYLVTFFDEGNTVIATAHAGRVLPKVLGGTLRVGLGPVLVRAERRERGLLAGLCFDDCEPVVYPPALVTGGLGVAVVQEWRPWPGVGLGLEGQLASGAQRFAAGTFRVTLGQ